MIRSMLILTGPGGVGKGPLANLIRGDAVAIDPYRLRPGGPRRKSEDPLYAHPKLRTELGEMLSTLGEVRRDIARAGETFVDEFGKSGNEKMEWFPKAKVLFFTVRGEWQCLIFHGLEGEVGKAELYAPALLAMLGIADIGDALGTPSVLVLNPANVPLATMLNDWTELEEKTRQNCKLRGDGEESIQKRVDTIKAEAPAWQRLIAERNAIELTGWSFPEYRFKPGAAQNQLLREARLCILDRAPQLSVFFKAEDEL